MYIYETINLLNGKRYVGKTKFNNPNYYGSGKILSRAIKKYGLSNFKRKILEICNDEIQLNAKECFWIQKLNSKYPNGYNLTDGGDGGDTISKNPNRDDIVRRMSEHTIFTEEQRKLISERSKNNPGWTIDKISKQERKSLADKQKRIRIRNGSYQLYKLISPDGDEYIGTMNEFSMQFNKSRTSLSCYRDKGKIASKYHQWKGWEIVTIRKDNYE